MTPDESPFPRIRIVSGRVLLFAASLSLLAYALFLTWGDAGDVPRDVTPATVCCAVPFQGEP